MKFIDLSKEDRLDILDRVSSELNIRQREVIEKDWWVTAVLRAMFSFPYANHLSFKGGTSLSKCWHLIDRFSEDIDIAIDREFLGFSGTLSKTQISDKLRRAACSFVRDTMQHDLAEQLYNNGISENKFKVNVNITPVTTTDPEVININYDSILSFSIDGIDGNRYILPKVKVEVSGRSMSEPVSDIAIDSMIDQVYPKAPFAEPKFMVRAVLPERTFLEKLFLLHEEFDKPKDLIRVERMSRHLYDIGQMLKTPIAERAINDADLYRQVVEHRRTFIGLRSFDYDTLYPETLNIVPPASVIEQWKTDYENMRLHMIYGESEPFDMLVGNLIKLNAKINATIYFIVPTVLYNYWFAQLTAIPLVLSFFQNRKLNFPFSPSNLTRDSFTFPVS